MRTIGEGASAGAAAPAGVMAAATGSTMSSAAGASASAGVKALDVRAISGMTSSGCFRVLAPASTCFNLPLNINKENSTTEDIVQ